MTTRRRTPFASFSVRSFPFMKKAIKITLICLGAIVTLFLLYIGLIAFAYAVK